VMDSFDRDETGLQPSCFLGTFPGALPQAGMEAGRWPISIYLKVDYFPFRRKMANDFSACFGGGTMGTTASVFAQRAQ
jgi:hypothetical protein